MLRHFVSRYIRHHPYLTRIVGNISWLLLDKILRMGVGVFVGVWLARYLGPEQFGQLSYAVAFVGLFGAVSALGLNGIVVRDIVRDPESAHITLGTAFSLQVIGGLSTLLVLLVAIRLLRPDDDVMIAMVTILGVGLVFKSGQVVKYWFESQVQSRFVVWVGDAVLLVIAAAKVILILAKAPLIAFVWIMLLDTVLVAIGCFTMYGKRVGPLKAWKVSGRRAVSLLRDSWPLVISGISVIAYMKIDQIMIGEIRGDADVGIYSVAVTLSEAWYFIPMVINQSLRPSLFRLREHSSSIYIRRLQRQFDLMVWLAVPIAVIMSFGSSEVISAIFGGAYLQSSDVLAIHVWAGIFVFLNNASWTWYFAENKQHIANIRLILGLLLNIVLNYVLIPQYGVLGAAWATLISRAFVAYFGQLLHAETRKLFFMMSRSLFLGGFHGNH